MRNDLFDSAKGAMNCRTYWNNHMLGSAINPNVLCLELHNAFRCFQRH
ncbi:hypothetical protein bcgnr5369_68260 [Bacillus cereus]